MVCRYRTYYLRSTFRTVPSFSAAADAFFSAPSPQPALVTDGWLLIDPAIGERRAYLPVSWQLFLADGSCQFWQQWFWIPTGGFGDCGDEM